MKFFFSCHVSPCFSCSLGIKKSSFIIVGRKYRSSGQVLFICLKAYQLLMNDVKTWYQWFIHNYIVSSNFPYEIIIIILARRPDLKKRICKIVDFAVSADHWIELKKCEKKDKYIDLARELKKLWNMKVTIIPIVIGAFGTVTKELLKALEDLEVGGRVETIQTTALLRTARILRRVLETWGDMLSLKFQWKPFASADVKN